MGLWRDTRHPAERAADEQYRAAREGVAAPVGMMSDPAAAVVAKVTDGEALEGAADRLVAARVISAVARDRRMSLLGKMQHLTESAQDFHKETEAALDGIAEKIALGRQKRDSAVEKHHGYYDAIIAGVDESTAVIDRLSNGPLPEGGGQ